MRVVGDRYLLRNDRKSSRLQTARVIIRAEVFIYHILSREAKRVSFTLAWFTLMIYIRFSTYSRDKLETYTKFE